MGKALYPGSFDPPTWGHIGLIRRAAKLFEFLYVGIAENVKKGKGLFTTEEKIAGLSQELHDLENVQIVPIPGLTVDAARKLGADVLLRGLRTSADLEFETEMARANYKLQEIDTLFMLGDEKTSSISSTLIRELATKGAALTEFIPPYFEQHISKRI